MKQLASHACARQFAHGMQEVLALLPGSERPRAIAVAYSGGADSTVLLHLAQDFAQQHGISLFAFHVHHGISPNADAWLAHCESGARQSGIPFFFERVTLDSASNLEAQARNKRYAALGRMCELHDVSLLLTAHHQDDQAETVLLHLLRGALSSKGMDVCKPAPGLLGAQHIYLARPLLGSTRADVLTHARVHNLPFVDDESNLDPKYARSALRTQVMPALATHFPGYQQVLARSSQHAQHTTLLLDELAQLDWQQYQAPAVHGAQAGLLAGTGLQMTALETLSAPRAHNLLRFWLALHGARLPSSSWLQELYGQLHSAREDAQVCVEHPDCEIHRYRNEIQLAPKWQPAPQSARFQWQGEPELAFPAFGGSLKFMPVCDEQAGIDVNWLRQQTLQLDYRQGGERIKLGANRPHRSLKQHYQTSHIPGWQRTRLPLVLIPGQPSGLLYAAGIGSASDFCGHAAERVRLEWHMHKA